MGKNLSIVTIFLLLLLASTSAGQVFDALTKAWKAVCAVAGSKVVISAVTYKLGVVTLLGPCKGAIEFNLQGTLQTPSNFASFNGKDFWVSFERIDSLIVSSGGVFDGKGQTAWQKNNCGEKYNYKQLPIIYTDITTLRNLTHHEIIIQALIRLMVLRILSYY
ncbi:hypothetical protein ACB092_03G164400 [Castanea dentata]